MDSAEEIRRDLNPSAAMDEAHAKADAAALAEDEAEAKAHGCTVEELRASRRFEMDLAEYLGYQHIAREGVTVADVIELEAEAKATREAKAEADRLDRIEKARHD